MNAGRTNTTQWRELRLVLRPFFVEQPRALLLGGLLAALTVLAGMALLGLSGWFITATALAGLHAATAFTFDVFMPSAGIRLLALGRTASRYGERLVTHDATFGVLAALRVRLFRGWARPEAARALLMRPARLLFRLTSDIDALESLYLRLLVPAAAALGAALLAGMVLGFMHVAMGAALALWLVFAGWGIAIVVARRARRPAIRRAHAIEALRPCRRFGRGPDRPRDGGPHRCTARGADARRCATRSGRSRVEPARGRFRFRLWQRRHADSRGRAACRRRAGERGRDRRTCSSTGVACGAHRY